MPFGMKSIWDLGSGMEMKKEEEGKQSEVPSGSQRGGDTLPAAHYTASYLFELYPTQASQCGGSWQGNLLVCKLLPMRGVRPPATLSLRDCTF